jgi:hypothetical protein
LVTSCVETLRKQIIDRKIGGGIEVTGREGRRHQQILDELKEMRRCWELKEEALDDAVWRTHCGRGCESVGRWTME